jgi:hypothetical protein
MRARLNSLNVWQRLGVIASVLWLGYAVVYSVGSPFVIDEGLAFSERIACADRNGGDIYAAECVIGEARALRAAEFEMRIGVFGLMVAMIPAAWIAAWIALRSIRWVWAGRKPA